MHLQVALCFDCHQALVSLLQPLHAALVAFMSAQPIHIQGSLLTTIIFSNAALSSVLTSTPITTKVISGNR